MLQSLVLNDDSSISISTHILHRNQTLFRGFTELYDATIRTSPTSRQSEK